MVFGNYASQLSEAKFPSLWQGLELSLMPTMQSPSGLTAYDFSRKNRHATANNVTLSTFWTRDGLLFDGTNDYLSFSGVTLSTSAPFTVSFRLKLTAFHASFPGLFGFPTNDSNGFVSFLSTSFSGMYNPISFGNSAGTFVRLRPATDFSAALVGASSFISITYNGAGASTAGNFTLSLNGVPQTLTTASTFASHGNVARIGVQGTTSNFVQGAISEFVVHSRVLTQHEQKLMAMQRNSVHMKRNSFVSGSSFNRRRRLLVGAGT